jgi:hypothetical protein
MPLDVFSLRDRVVQEYRDYFESFINIQDARLRLFVEGELRSAKLWPDAVLQLNPAYQPDLTLGELAAKGVIHRDVPRFFGDLRLYQHQREALDIALRG